MPIEIVSMMNATHNESDDFQMLSEEHWNRFAVKHALSDREVEVLQFLCRGLRTQAILGELGIQMPTLRTHLRAIYRKLDCGSRLEAVLRVVHYRLDGEVHKITKRIEP